MTDPIATRIAALSVTHVPAAALLLDHTVPGWAGQIDLDTFDIASAHDCILGQLFGCYAFGIDRLCRAHGLRHSMTDGVTDVLTAFHGWIESQHAWTREIRMRLDIAREQATAARPDSQHA